MLVSIYKLDFIATSDGATTTLLSAGDLIEREIEWPMNNQAQNYSPIGAQWGKARATGGARRPVDFARYVEHASHAAAASYCITHPAGLPFVTPGKLRVTITGTGGVVYDLMDSVILAAVTRKTADGEFATLSSYRIDTGKPVLVT